MLFIYISSLKVTYKIFKKRMIFQYILYAILEKTEDERRHFIRTICNKVSIFARIKYCKGGNNEFNFQHFANIVRNLLDYIPGLRMVMAVKNFSPKYFQFNPDQLKANK